MNSRERQQRLHEWYAMQPADRKLEAEYRREVLELAEGYQKGKNLPENYYVSRLNLTASMSKAADETGLDVATIWRWRAKIDGWSKIDWLPWLCPRKTMPVLNLPSACIIADGVK